MARARTIKHGFFTNDELGGLPQWTRLLFAGLWIVADREGRLLDRPKKIKTDVLPYDKVDVNHGLELLAERHFIARYEVDGVGCIQVLNWAKHQSPHPREAASEIPSMPVLGNGPARNGQFPSNGAATAGPGLVRARTGSLTIPSGSITGPLAGPAGGEAGEEEKPPEGWEKVGMWTDSHGGMHFSTGVQPGA